MFIEKDVDAAVVAYVMGKEVVVMDCESGQNISMEDFLKAQDYLHFLVREEEDAPDPEELHTDEEFEEQFEAVPEEPKKKMSRAEKRHMIETLAAEGSMGVSEIAARVGDSVATVRKHIK